MNPLRCFRCQPDGWPSYVCPGCIDKFIPLTNAQRQAAFRARKAATPEVRGIFAPPADHAAIKKAALALAAKTRKK